MAFSLPGALLGRKSGDCGLAPPLGRRGDSKKRSMAIKRRGSLLAPSGAVVAVVAVVVVVVGGEGGGLMADC